jgi:hypothetical protein
MEIRGNSESAFQIMICAEVRIAELIEGGPEAFAQRAREMLEAELKPLLEIDWKNRGAAVPSAGARDVLGR